MVPTFGHGNFFTLAFLTSEVELENNHDIIHDTIFNHLKKFHENESRFLL